jgi:hypothetical protein
LAPALLGALCLLPLPSSAARKSVGAVGAAGSVVGLIVFAVRNGDAVWRTTRAEPAAVAVVGIAIACSFTLLWAVHRADGWLQTATGGVAGSALLLAACSQWTAPLLLFWLTSTVALGVMTHMDERRSSIWAALFASDAFWVAAVLLEALETESWRFGLSPDETTRWLVLAAIVLRGGAALRVGVWGAASRVSAAAVPLMVAGAFVILARAEPGANSQIAVGLLLVAVGTCAWAALKRPGDVSSVGAWVSSLMLSACFVVPELTTRAGIAVVIAASTAALWEWTTSGARVWRAAILGLAPMTVGFGVIVAAAITAFDRAAGAQEVIDAAPWTAIGAMLLLAVGLGIVVAVRIARLAEPAVHVGWETLAMWGLFAASVLLGLLPVAEIGLPGGVTGPALRPFLLHGAALASAVLVGWIVYRRNENVVTRHAGGTVTSGAFRPRPAPAAVLTALSLVLLAASVGATAWLTVQGLLVGFL